jgi:hypothetical protein
MAESISVTVVEPLRWDMYKERRSEPGTCGSHPVLPPT